MSLMSAWMCPSVSVNWLVDLLDEILVGTDDVGGMGCAARGAEVLRRPPTLSTFRLCIPRTELTLCPSCAEKEGLVAPIRC